MKRAEHMWSKVRFQVTQLFVEQPEPEDEEITQKTQSPHSPLQSLRAKNNNIDSQKNDSLRNDVHPSSNELLSAPPNTTSDTISFEDDATTITGSMEQSDTCSLTLGRSSSSKKKDKPWKKRPKTPKFSVCLNPKDQRDAQPLTSIYVAGVGSIPVVKGDPKILPEKVLKFVAEKAFIMRPRAIYICDGSIHERDEMARKLKNQGVLRELKGYLNAYHVRTNPDDAARVEAKTFITTKDRNTTETRKWRRGTASEVARWMPQEQLVDELDSRFPDCMRGRMMYVVPFSMGPIGGFYSKACIQLTDSPYVVLVSRIMYRVNLAVLDMIGDQDFIKCIHSVGLPRPCTLKIPQNWPCRPSKILIAHRMEEQEVWSFGSGYGGNSLLGKKCVALRLASSIGRREGWLAEHMAIVSFTNPEGKEYFVCVGMPSGCGKTNLALMKPALPGWKVKTIGDDIAWLRFGGDGRLYAMNPENGMFGIAAGSNMYTNPGAIRSLKKDFVLTNAADTSDGRFMWQGLEDQIGISGVTDWTGRPWKIGTRTLPAHPNSRFAVPCSNNPMRHELWDSPAGVPVSAIIYGGRRPDGYPLVFESYSWANGVFQAASLKSETTAASIAYGNSMMQHDPMGMRPFIGYNFADYLSHWLSMDLPGRKVPKIFHVNFYRREKKTGELLWPGFGENIRVLEWILRRCSETPPKVINSPLGFMPYSTDINTKGVAVDLPQLLVMSKSFLEKDVADTRMYFEDQLGKDMPKMIEDELCALEKRIAVMPQN